MKINLHGWSFLQPWYNINKTVIVHNNKIIFANVYCNFKDSRSAMKTFHSKFILKPKHLIKRIRIHLPKVWSEFSWLEQGSAFRGGD